MTNINCSKSCKYQSDGKCCCDSVMLSFYDPTSHDPDCPYQKADAKECKTENAE